MQGHSNIGLSQAPALWINPEYGGQAQEVEVGNITINDVLAAEQRLARFAPLLKKLFPELDKSAGIVESPLLSLSADVIAPGADEEKITEAAIEAGADDIVVYPDDASIDVITAPENFQSVKDAMDAAGLSADHAEITFRADNDIAVAADVALQVKKLLDMLEDLDDVQDVYSNVDQASLGSA